MHEANMKLLFFSNSIRQTAVRGFVLPLTLIICVIILTISAGISIILAKELYFSKLSRLSQVAYYAADNGMMCATMIDDKYIDPSTGLGIFPYATSPTEQQVLDKVNAQRESNGLTTDITLANIKCATSDIFTPAISGYAVTNFSRTDSQGNPDSGKTATFSMTMDLGDGTTRCATVSISKTAKYRQIISRGFASCSTTSLFRIERAIVNTTEVR
jgi:hypothetical protein